MFSGTLGFVIGVVGSTLKVNELSPQGDDLSKAMLLFTEWKPLGEIGRYWLYVRAYELLRKIFAPESDKISKFDDQVKWVEQHLGAYLKMLRN